MTHMNEQELNKVTGGVELIDSEASVEKKTSTKTNANANTIPYCCPECKSIINIVAGASTVKCKCGYKGVISG